MRKLLAMAVALALVLGTTSDAFAQGAAPAPTAGGTTKVVDNTTAAIGMGLSVLGIGIGLGLIGFAALSGIARQPEQAGAIQGAMFIIAGLVEGAGIISLVLCLVTIFV
ncbi:MAG TPA: ATP synthase F0 subunit C [Fimbriiglobus sp.]|jgi:ATP synthase F0 subunit c|nr:ATP synthase F0 subunit C [Fimbriiglobus sp.]